MDRHYHSNLVASAILDPVTLLLDKGSSVLSDSSCGTLSRFGSSGLSDLLSIGPCHHLSHGPHFTDEIRARVAGTVLEELFTHSPTTLATPVLDALVRTLLIEYGVQLHKLLVTRIRPDPVVRSALNEIPARRRETWAASHQAEAHKVEVVARAQAHAERLSLLGRGTARQRRVLLEQFWYESVHEWIHNVYLAPPQVPSTQDLLTLLLITQYLDVITAVGAPKKPHTSEHAAQQQQDTKESCLVLHHNDFGRPLQSPLAAAAAASLRAVTNTRRDSDTHRASSSSSSSSYHKDMLQLIPAATTT